ncbi:MAG: LemA family protein [Acidobacteriota bacterium]
MNKTLIGCGAALLVVLIVGGLAVAGSYNSLVKLDEGVKSAWAQVENVYQRRADLVPNLVETVKGAAAFERDTFTAVTEARSRVGQLNLGSVPSAEQLQQFQAAQDGLSSALSRLLVVVEKYPDLKATANFQELQSQLEGTENRITVERRRFNEVAQAFNTARRRFPTVLIAGVLGFNERPYFQAAPGSDKAPQVKF